MIVHPDFLDHWKTRLLCDLLKDESAPLYVIRLWGHCQTRKTHRFPAGNPAITKAICKAPQTAKIFHKAMLESGFIEISDEEIVVHEWDSVNAYLVNSWENGKKGGRPKNKPAENPRDNPPLTGTKPIREEKNSNREVEEEYTAAAAALLDDPNFENAIRCIRVCHRSPDGKLSFSTVSQMHLENSLRDQPDRKSWHPAITGMAAAYAGAELPRPNKTLQNWLAGKPDEKNARAQEGSEKIKRMQI
jgi:hypothetical protein